ncbi:hypothetical protein OS493_007931 [Desmophyllum pertusum]|uniref:Uncharacterized protein n=1 Tax=Desmophyllum pertusum TaxID=174260 RepID=A0A9W9YEP3_9CNID|nr:hypothetical protein OS493_007931 [Desmophyllum pertusum]
MRVKAATMDFYDALDVSYSAPLNLAQPGRGRKRYEITKDQVEHLRSLYFSWEAIAGILQVSVSTLQRRRKGFGLSDSVSFYSDLSDDELDEIYKSITGSSTTGHLNTPNIGRRRFIGALRSRGLNVQRWRISECLRRVDPVGTALRWRMTIHRRKYYVPTPNSLWHIDSGHKLISALSETEIEHFGVDPNGVLAVEDEDYQVEISPPLISLPDEQLPQLPDPLSDDGNGGKDLYLQCIEIINMFPTSS